jgi:hypothetical protein
MNNQLLLINVKKTKHCFDRWKVRVGDQSHATTTSRTLLLDIVRVSLHPNYNGRTSYFDVAIVETQSIIFSKLISPICLPR